MNMRNLRVLIATVVFLAPAFGAPLLLVVPNGLTSTPGNMLDNTGSGNTNAGNTLITDTFATNLGPDNTLVYSVTLSGPGCAGPSARPFDLV
jgi:hypothetical protein